MRADLADVAFAPSSFDAAIAFDSIWHVPHQEHPCVFANLREWLVDGAVALITLAAAPDGKGELFTHLLGAPIYYDARPVEKSLQVLRAAGFSVLDHHMEPVSATRPLSGHLMVLVEAA